MLFIAKWFNASLHAVATLLNQPATVCLRTVVFKNNVTFNFELVQLLSSCYLIQENKRFWMITVIVIKFVWFKWDKAIYDLSKAKIFCEKT